MFRSILALILSTTCAFAIAENCSLQGTAYDVTGKPLRHAVVRLTNQQTHQTNLSATDANAAFQFTGLTSDESGQVYRLDMLGTPITVTGSHIRTRSVVGRVQEFACHPGRSEHQDVHDSTN
jgi:hypothetical protein